MRYWTSALAVLAAAGGPALAQVPPPPEEQPPPGPTEPPPTPTPEPPPPPAPPPRPALPPPPPPPPAAPPAAPAAADGSQHRPSELSIAIGLGYQLPTSLQTPNITSVRLRLAGGLTFEPRLTLATSSEVVDTGPSTTDKQTEVGLGALARLPLVRRGRVDLELLGGLDVDRTSTRPEEDDEDLSITTFAAVYGVSVATWINRHWQVSLSALNPLVTSTRRDEEMGPGTSTVTTNTTIGLIFDPNVSLMVHLYH
jgi:hypothetical protein